MAALLLTGASLSTVFCDAPACLTLEACKSSANLYGVTQAQNQVRLVWCRDREAGERKGSRLPTVLAVHKMSLLVKPSWPVVILRPLGRAALAKRSSTDPYPPLIWQKLDLFPTPLSWPEIYGALAVF